nr:lipoprotein [Rhodoferax sp. UBA5149]
MLRFSQILVSSIVLGISAVSLSACGQQGPLYLPTEPASARRATLPETLMRSSPINADQSAVQTAPSPVSPPTPAAIPAPQ